MAAYSCIARWLLDEASSGTTPTECADDEGSNDLTIDYSSGDAAWTSIGAGNGLDFIATPITTNSAVAELDDIANNGNIGSSLDGVGELSITVVCSVDAGNDSGARIFFIGSDSGDGDVAIVHYASNLWVRYNDEGVFNGEASYPSISGSGVTVVHVVIDTSQSTSADRIKVWYDGSAQTQASQGGGYPAQNDTLDSINSSSYSMCLGNRPSGNRNFEGQIYYAELGTGSLSGTQISDSNTALAADNDADWQAGGGGTILPFRMRY